MTALSERPVDAGVSGQALPWSCLCHLWQPLAGNPVKKEAIESRWDSSAQAPRLSGMRFELGLFKSSLGIGTAEQRVSFRELFPLLCLQVQAGSPFFLPSHLKWQSRPGVKQLISARDLICRM